MSTAPVSWSTSHSQTAQPFGNTGSCISLSATTASPPDNSLGRRAPAESRANSRKPYALSAFGAEKRPSAKRISAASASSMWAAIFFPFSMSPFAARENTVAAWRGALAAGFETVPVGDPHRKIHVVLVGAAVVGHSHRVPVGHRLRAYEVLSAQLDPVHAELRGGGVDQALDRKVDLGPSGAAIGSCRRRGCEDRAASQGGSGDVVATGDKAGSLRKRRERNAARADVGEVGGAHREKFSIDAKRELDLGDEVPPLVVGEEGFGSRGGEFDRAPELA